jgi:hypothetical protein
LYLLLAILDVFLALSFGARDDEMRVKRCVGAALWNIEFAALCLTGKVLIKKHTLRFLMLGSAAIGLAVLMVTRLCGIDLIRGKGDPPIIEALVVIPALLYALLYSGWKVQQAIEARKSREFQEGHSRE